MVLFLLRCHVFGRVVITSDINHNLYVVEVDCGGQYRPPCGRINGSSNRGGGLWQRLSGGEVITDLDIQWCGEWEREDLRLAHKSTPLLSTIVIIIEMISSGDY